MELKLVIDATPQLLEALINVATALRGGSPAMVEVKEEAPKKPKAKSKPVEEPPIAAEEEAINPPAEKRNAPVVEEPETVKPVVESTATDEALVNARKKHTLEECTQVARGLIERSEHAKLKAALAEVGAKTVSVLQPDQFENFLKACQ